MLSTKPAEGPFREGDEVVLAHGSYQGTLGVFIGLRPDVNWADVTESNGRVRCHPVAWLALSNAAPRLVPTQSASDESSRPAPVLSTL
jgi:hypothetical protein